MRLRVGSLFSGVGGFEAGFEAAGFEIAWQCEIDKDCVSVLERHWPDVPRYGDIRTVNGADLAPVDVIVGGPPCQDFSIAGKRAGLVGARSGLFWDAIRIVEEMREATDGRYPAVACFENVPGILSSHAGRDFAALLGGLQECGAAVAWRILDARFFGVPQRRRRVFIVADFAEPGVGERRAAEILSLFPSSSGDSAPSGAARQGAAGDAADGAGVVGFDARNGTDTGDTSIAIQAGAGNGRGVSYNCLPLVGAPATDGVGTLAYSESGPGWWRDGVGTLRAEGENRPSRPSSLVMPPVAAFGGNRTSGPIDVATACNAHGGPHGRLDFESETFVVGALPSGGTPLGHGTAGVNNQAVNAGHVIPVAFHLTQDPINGPESPALGAGNEKGCSTVAVAYGFGTSALDTPQENLSPPLMAKMNGQRTGSGPTAYVAVGFMQKASNRVAEESVEDGSPPLRGTNNPVAVAVAISENQRAEVRETPYACPITAGGGKPGQGYPSVRSGMAVRRLTPTECCRLMGWPDDHVRFRADGSPIPDGAQYRMIGNGVVSNVAFWIAARLRRVLEAS